jgi:hypothetical protein
VKRLKREILLINIGC